MDFQESKTNLNIQNLYETELMISAKYELFGVIADRETLIEIRNAFNDISRNERVVAERLRRILFQGQTSTQQNLLEAESNDNLLKQMCQEYSAIATEEGYTEIASLLNGIANIKINHSNVFRAFADDMENNQLFCKPEPVVWVCLACGNIMTRECAPERCPVCGYPQGYYHLLRD